MQNSWLAQIQKHLAVAFFIFSSRTLSRDMNMKFARLTLPYRATTLCHKDNDTNCNDAATCHELSCRPLTRGCASIFGHVVATILLVLKCSVALISGSLRKIPTAAIKSILCRSQRFMAIAADLFWLRPTTNYKAINVYVVLSVYSVLSRVLWRLCLHKLIYLIWCYPRSEWVFVKVHNN